ncbi:glycosyltransferase family 47 protein [Desulfovibrio sp. OttesenSCG-928-G15]|nr:glycosyltransferase family 47 protein [Desulfovibrio sp. OttesenSCG-928-G15]
MRAYMYREGVDFAMPPELAPVERHKLEPPDGVVPALSGERLPDPDFFTPASPQEADIFLFPYDLGHFVNILRPKGCAEFLRSLPYLSGREGRHVFSDNGDVAECLPLPVGLLKRSLLRSYGAALPDKKHIFQATSADSPRCIVTWYELPAHVAADKPHFDWRSLRYDCSFVGAFTHMLRQVACAAMEKEEGLRFYNGGFDSIFVQGNAFYSKEQTPEERMRKQEIFRRVTKDSLLVLCPPGVGPQSVRMYETMYYGRVPVLFTTTVRYPLEDSLDYSAFSFTVPEKYVLQTGRMVRSILMEHGKEALCARGRLACKIWSTRFSNAGRGKAMAGYIRELAGMA